MSSCKLQILGCACGLETLLCSFNCGRMKPRRLDEASVSELQTPYDKMVQESSTHFTLHETTSRAVTTDNIHSKAPSAPPPPPPPAPVPVPVDRKRQPTAPQSLVNENYRPESDPVCSSKAPKAKHNQSKTAAAAAVKPKSTAAEVHNQYKASANDDQAKKKPDKPSSSKGPSANGDKHIRTTVTTATIERNNDKVPPPPAPPNDNRISSNPVHKAPEASVRITAAKKPEVAGSTTIVIPPTTTTTTATPQPPSTAKSAITLPTAECQPPAAPAVGPNTGAIPKKKRHHSKAVTESTKNHMDEIVSLPLDDFSSFEPPPNSNHKTRNGDRPSTIAGCDSSSSKQSEKDTASRFVQWYTSIDYTTTIKDAPATAILL